MADVKQTMLELLITSLQMANDLVRAGHASFWCFAVALRTDGCRVCIVSNEADFLPLLSAQPQVIEELGPNLTAAGPVMTTECLGANQDEAEADEEGHEATVARLRELAGRGEIIATAVVTTEPDFDRSPGPVPTIWVELEHRDGWALLYAQPYSTQGGEFQVGDADQYEHE